MLSGPKPVARSRFFTSLRDVQNDRIVGGRGDRGVAYLMALVGLVTLSILGLAALRLANAQLTEARGLDRAKKLTNAALAGVEYGYYTYIYNFADKTVPWSSGQVSLGDTWFAVTIVDYPDIAGAVRITATAHLGNDTAAETRICRRAGADNVFRYAICSGSDLTSVKSKTVGASGENGDVHANGNLSWTSSAAIINGNVSATGTISTPYPTVTGTTTAGAAAVAFPSIDLSYYQSIADAVYTGDHDFTSGITFPSDYYVIYVGGNSEVEGTVTGRGIVVVAGQLDIVADLTYANSASDKLALISAESANIKTHGTTVDGFIYVHATDNSGLIGDSNTKDSTVRGGLAADQVGFTSVGADNTVIHDPDFSDADFCRAMHLPGSTD